MVNAYFELIAIELGISVGLFTTLLYLFLAWSMTWKLLALWKAARKGSIPWFVILAIFNTVGVLPILYIFVFSHLHQVKPVAKKKPAKKRKKK